MKGCRWAVGAGWLFREGKLGCWWAGWSQDHVCRQWSGSPEKAKAKPGRHVSGWGLNSGSEAGCGVLTVATQPSWGPRVSEPQGRRVCSLFPGSPPCCPSPQLWHGRPSLCHGVPSLWHSQHIAHQRWQNQVFCWGMLTYRYCLSLRSSGVWAHTCWRPNYSSVVTGIMVSWFVHIRWQAEGLGENQGVAMLRWFIQHFHNVRQN